MDGEFLFYLVLALGSIVYQLVFGKKIKNTDQEESQEDLSSMLERLEKEYSGGDKQKSASVDSASSRSTSSDLGYDDSKSDRGNVYGEYGSKSSGASSKSYEENTSRYQKVETENYDSEIEDEEESYVSPMYEKYTSYTGSLEGKKTIAEKAKTFSSDNKESSLETRRTQPNVETQKKLRRIERLLDKKDSLTRLIIAKEIMEPKYNKY